ncbi:MAG: hypothetical protein ABS81_09550 [Pseudonocardia sp. SCN 72-86]|nr:MAG: hypothetical protein ABS81_09550 [Pseudonocardia sp. SCN 72-86]
MGKILDGKVALVTGGGGGFGRLCARLFAAAGASVVVAERSADRMNETVQLVQDAGCPAVGVLTDVSVEDQVREAVATAEREFGGLDIMMNNAGISPPPGLPIEEITEAQWDSVIDVNLKGAFFGCKHATSALRRRGGGAILNISSGASLAAYPGVPVYSASKGGMNALGRSLAIDLGKHNIRVNTLCPSGGMSANMLLDRDAPQVDEDSQWKDWDPSTFYAPLWRDRPPRMIDHANVALFLVSPAAGYLTGVALASDGGMAAKAAVDVGKLLENWSTVAE